MLAGAKTLAKKEAATGTAIQAVDRRGKRAVPAARRRIAAVRREAADLARTARAHETSTQAGSDARTRLVTLLGVERREYGRLDTALVAFRDGHRARAKRLIRQAATRLQKVASDAVKLGRTIGGLSQPAPSTGSEPPAGSA